MNEGSTSSKDSPRKDVSTGSTPRSNLEVLRRANLEGKIPVRLTLAQTSLSSAVSPQPQHILLSRQTYLHLGLESSIRKLHEYALPTLSFLGGNTNRVVVQEDDDEPAEGKPGDTSGPTVDGSSEQASDSSNSNAKQKPEEEANCGNNGEEDETPDSKEPYPICWFEDVATGQPLRWQYFVGVLFDSLHRSHTQTTIPWEIRLHFRSYPSQQLLELSDPDYGHTGGVLETLKHIFRNSLKQGFVIRYGNSKQALNISKQSHDAIWEGIATNHYDNIASVVYRDDEFDNKDEPDSAVKENNNDTEEPKIDEGSSIPKNTARDDPSEDADTVREQPIVAIEETKQDNLQINNMVMVPVRLSIDPSKPMIQKRLEGGTSISKVTLGSLLVEWAPMHFERIGTKSADQDENKNENENENKNENENETRVESTRDPGEIQPTHHGTTWKIAGLMPPLSMPLLDLWLALRHPDNFLYISLSIERR